MEMKDLIGGLVRHVLTIAGGALVANGSIDASQSEVLIGAFVAIFGVGWSVWQKKKPSEKLAEATAAPAVEPKA